MDAVARTQTTESKMIIVTYKDGASEPGSSTIGQTVKDLYVHRAVMDGDIDFGAALPEFSVMLDYLKARNVASIGTI